VSLGALARRESVALELDSLLGGTRLAFVMSS